MLCFGSGGYDTLLPVDFLYQTTRKPSSELCLLNKRIFEFYTRSAKIIDVAGYHCQVVNQCNRSNLFAYRMFGVW